jgi:hypothetical protein
VFAIYPGLKQVRRNSKHQPTTIHVHAPKEKVGNKRKTKERDAETLTIQTKYQQYNTLSTQKFSKK